MYTVTIPAKHSSVADAIRAELESVQPDCTFRVELGNCFQLDAPDELVGRELDAAFNELIRGIDWTYLND